MVQAEREIERERHRGIVRGGRLRERERQSGGRERECRGRERVTELIPDPLRVSGWTPLDLSLTLTP